jgi:hypothetical protein
LRRPYQEDLDVDGRVCEAIHVAHCRERSAGFDLVHNHLDWLPLAMSGLCRAPMLTTIHGIGDRRVVAACRGARSAFVSISDAHRVPYLDYLATVHHGIDVSEWPFVAEPGEGLVAVGRIHPDKATAQAIEIARRLERPLEPSPPSRQRYGWTGQWSLRPRVGGSARNAWSPTICDCTESCWTKE